MSEIRVTSRSEARVEIAALSDNASKLVRRFGRSPVRIIEQVYRHHRSVETTGDTQVVMQMMLAAYTGDFKLCSWLLNAIHESRRDEQYRDNEVRR